MTGAAIGTALGCAVANASGMYTCEEEEFVDLQDPVVTLIEGPGDAALEQGRWPDDDSHYDGVLNFRTAYTILEEVEP